VRMAVACKLSRCRCSQHPPAGKAYVACRVQRCQSFCALYVVGHCEGMRLPAVGAAAGRRLGGELPVLPGQGDLCSHGPNTNTSACYRQKCRSVLAQGFWIGMRIACMSMSACASQLRASACSRRVLPGFCRHSITTAECVNTPSNRRNFVIIPQIRQCAAPSWPLQVYSQLEGDTSHVVNTAWALLALVRGGCSDHTVSCLVPAVHLGSLRGCTGWQHGVELAIVIRNAAQFPTGALGRLLDFPAARRPWQQQRGA
jgi:hypothetical protein